MLPDSSKPVSDKIRTVQRDWVVEPLEYIIKQKKPELSVGGYYSPNLRV